MRPYRTFDWHLGQLGLALEDLKRSGRRYRYLYAVFSRARDYESTRTETWVERSVEEWVERQLLKDKDWLMFADLRLEKGRSTDLVDAIYDGAEEALASALHTIMYSFDEGLALYRRGQSGELTLVQDDDPIAVFLLELVRQDTPPSYSELPAWARVTFVKAFDMRAHAMLYWDSKWPDSEAAEDEIAESNYFETEKKQLKRAALKLHLQGKLVSAALTSPAAAASKEVSDWQYWTEKSDLWTIVQASYLLAGFEPIDASMIPYDGSAMSRNYELLKNGVLARTIESIPPPGGKIGQSRLKPLDVVTWANEKKLSIPSQLAILLESRPPSQKPCANERVDERERTAYLNTIGALLRLLLEPQASVGSKARPMFPSQSKVIEAIQLRHQGKYGISKRNLDDILAEANRSIDSTE